MFFAIREFLLTFHAAWKAADLPRRLASWWYVVTHQHLIDGPPPEELLCHE
jgi:hypothetical protein